MKLFLLVAILFPFLALADATKCYDANNVVLVEAPHGWIADYETGKKMGVCSFFFPDGFTFDNAPVVFYPNLVSVVANPKNGKIDLKTFISDDLKKFKQQSPKLKIDLAPEFKNSSALKFSIRKLSNGSPPNEFETIAYLPLKSAVLIGVFSARKREDLLKYEKFVPSILNLIKIEKRTALFPEQKAMAQKDLTSEAGQKFEAEYMSAIAGKLSQAMVKCSKPGDLGFNAVLQITDQGAIQNWTNENDSEKSSGSCLKTALKNAKGPKPPFSPFHLLIEMTIQP